MYNTIINPITKKKLSIFSKNGKQLLKKYILQFRGGSTDCAICLEKLIDNDENVITCNCNSKVPHKFHKNCLEQRLDDKCPICRRPCTNVKTLQQIKEEKSTDTFNNELRSNPEFREYLEQVERQQYDINQRRILRIQQRNERKRKHTNCNKHTPNTAWKCLNPKELSKFKNACQGDTENDCTWKKGNILGCLGGTCRNDEYFEYGDRNYEDQFNNQNPIWLSNISF